MAASLSGTRFLRTSTPDRFSKTLRWLASWQNQHRTRRQPFNKVKRSRNNNMSYEETGLSYCEMLKLRQKEAEKSIIVEFTLGTNVKDILHSVKDIGGRVKEAFFYKMNNMGYVLFEFENPEAVQHFRSNRLDLYRLLRFHQRDSDRFHRTLPPFISKDELMGVDFDIRLLDTAETLSDQIRTLHYYLRMRQQQKRCQFFVCHQVQETVQKLYPGAVVLPFGSGATGFGLAAGSDLDMVMMVNRPPEAKFISNSLSYAVNEPDTRLDRSTNYLKNAGNLLHVSAGITDVEFILRARVPIIKFRHSFTDLECDLSANNYSGPMMSQILYAMSQYDERFHTLVTVIKTWGRASGVTKASAPWEGLSSFMLNMLVMHFLQTRKEPVLPAINDMYRPDVSEDQVGLLATSTEESFLKDVSQLPQSQNTQSLGDLLLEFYQYFARFDFSKYTIDLRNATLSEADGLFLQTKGYNCIRVINPCDETHNICRIVKRKYLEKFQNECQNALERLEKNVNKGDNSPWGLSYVVNPALTETHAENLSDSLKTPSAVNIENLYDLDEVMVETDDFKDESSKENS